MPLRIALAQMNASVGDIDGNLDRMRAFRDRAADYDADLLVFPEMSLCGYPPEDLLLKRHFLADMRAALQRFAAESAALRATMLVGFAEQVEGLRYNSLAVVRGGRIETVYHKGLLPNYGVFDEKRYFTPGFEACSIQVNGCRLGLTICEDLWDLPWLDKFRGGGEVDLMVNISASPFHFGKLYERRQLLANCARHFHCMCAYCNLVGGQDELVFDGRSMVVDASGEPAVQAAAFEDDLLVADLEAGRPVALITDKPAAVEQPPLAEVYQALVLGTRDYIRKNGFGKVLIGLSGGIDSSITAVIAVEALGPENVVGVTMPSRFNSPDTVSDAERTARNLGIEFHTVPIAGALDALSGTLAHVPEWSEGGIAYENLQSRIRGTLLMSLSNQFGYLVLTTGNKSETAVGYSTLYGDTAGGFAVIKDVPKTMVYDLSRYVNQHYGREVIPVSVIDREPSAELRPDQRDTDSLPDYDLLDAVLKAYIEQDQSRQELLAAGHDEATVRRVIRMVDRNEYKRRQSPPGIKITPKAFGRDRRMPITNLYGG